MPRRRRYRHVGVMVLRQDRDVQKMSRDRLETRDVRDRDVQDQDDNPGLKNPVGQCRTMPAVPVVYTRPQTRSPCR